MKSVALRRPRLRSTRTASDEHVRACSASLRFCRRWPNAGACNRQRRLAHCTAPRRCALMGKHGRAQKRSPSMWWVLAQTHPQPMSCPSSEAAEEAGKACLEDIVFGEHVHVHRRCSVSRDNGRRNVAKTHRGVDDLALMYRLVPFASCVLSFAVNVFALHDVIVVSMLCVLPLCRTPRAPRSD